MSIVVFLIKRFSVGCQEIYTDDTIVEKLLLIVQWITIISVLGWDSE